MYLNLVKPLLDKLIAFIAIIVFSPVLIGISLIIFIFEGRPILYLQERVGQYGKIFRIYKFRTMVNNADKIGPLSTQKNDKRITIVGLFLRKTSLDELPQLFNVLNGTMSLVGYRPDVWRYNDNYLEKKYRLKPGITGLAQVYGRSKISLSEREFLENDYVYKVSFTTDFHILMRTIYVVLFQRGVN